MRIFGETSGLFMNPSKSTLWTLGPQHPVDSWASTLQITNIGLKYLGVFLSDSQEISWERNILPVWSRVRDELKRWSHMPLSLLDDRPYLRWSLCLTFYINYRSTLFVYLHLGSDRSTRLWACFYGPGSPTEWPCVPAIYPRTLVASLPSDVLSYYMASHLMVLNEWWYGGRSDPAYALERERMGPQPIHTILYSAPLPRALPAATHIVFLIWKQALRKIGWWGRLTQETPLWSNGLLPQLTELVGFRGWDAIGISKLGDVMHGKVLKSFQQLQTEFAMPKTQSYKYLQLRHALRPSIIELGPYQRLVL